MQISDPLVPGCRLGPLVNELQYKKVVGYVEAGKADGATLLTGGRRPPHMPKGYYLEPTGEGLWGDGPGWADGWQLQAVCSGGAASSPGSPFAGLGVLPSERHTVTPRCSTPHAS